jgi:pyridoxal phosphate-dependent aminotransferase EpsN
MKRIFLSPPHIGNYEKKYIDEVFESNYIAPVGKHITRFENEIAERFGVCGALALSSGTAAIHLALRLLNVQPNDIVFCASLTFVGSANPILYEKAIPVFIDAEPETWNMSPSALECAFQKYLQMGKKPKAVIIVDLYGQCADMDAILNICNKYDTPVIEDAAEAIGAKYKSRYSGSFGDYGIYSFNGNKMITTSGGGMLLSDNLDDIKKARYWSTQARDPVVHYEHSEMGFNYRMSNVLAAIGLGQLRILNDNILSCNLIFQQYVSALNHISGIDFMPEPKGYESNRWLTLMTMAPSVMSPIEMVNHLEAHNIESRPVWKPMHMQPLFKGTDFFSHNSDVLPVCEELFKTGICLPSGPGMTKEEQSRVIACILSKLSQ